MLQELAVRSSIESEEDDLSSGSKDVPGSVLSRPGLDRAESSKSATVASISVSSTAQLQSEVGPARFER